MGDGKRWTKESAAKQLGSYKVVDAATKQVHAAVCQYLEDMWNDREPYLLALLGNPGTGKTFIAQLVNAFFQVFMRQRPDRELSSPGEQWLCAGGFTDWATALREMLDTRDWGRMGNFRHDFFLVLDDIMAEHNKQRELSASKLFEILNSRQGRRWTIVTANADLGIIEAHLDARISSRLIRDRNVCITLPVDMPDYAMRPKK